MEIKERISRGLRIVYPIGRFDANEAPNFAKWIDAHVTADSPDIIVNMGGTSFVDSAGLAALVTGLKRCRSFDGDLYLCQLQPAVTVVIELTRLDKVFKIYEDEQDALAAVK
ncbi:MAG: anti-anti-sigma factor [Anaerolineaceae bacterium]|nr:anti-anti-sigma factor [Anaerolineaceae bacterium]